MRHAIILGTRLVTMRWARQERLFDRPGSGAGLLPLAISEGLRLHRITFGIPRWPPTEILSRSMSILPRWLPLLAAMCLSSAAIIFGVPRLTFSQVEVTEKTFNKFVVPATAFNATLSDNDFLATWDAVPDRFPGLMDETSGWKRCLPIDVARCGIGEGPMQTLLAIAEGETPCNSAVLHMMLTEVVHIANTLLGLPTVITYGTLLGAQRNQSIIPYTQDADACIVANDYRQLAEALWYRGYVLFPRFNMASVCVGLHHPLAKKLFSPLGRVDGHYLGRSPYVDIYTWSYDQTGGPSSDVVFDGRIHMRHDDVFPLAYLNVFNTSFPAPRNAIAFLEKEYGSGWSIPDH